VLFVETVTRDKNCQIPYWTFNGIFSIHYKVLVQNILPLIFRLVIVSEKVEAFPTPLSKRNHHHHISHNTTYSHHIIQRQSDSSNARNL